MDSIDFGTAYNKFEEMVKYQKGNIKGIKVSDNQIKLKAKKSGVIKNINALELGKLSQALGAGKVKKSDKIDYTVGIKLNKLVGDEVKKGDILATIYVNKSVPEVNIDNIFIIE